MVIVRCPLSILENVNVNYYKEAISKFSQYKSIDVIFIF